MTLTEPEVWTIENQLEAEEDLMIEVLFSIYMRPQKTKSDLARVEASYVAALACQGFITTSIGEDLYSDVWRPTDLGIKLLKERKRL